MPFSTKMHSRCSKSYMIEYKATVLVIVISVLAVYKYEEGNVEFNMFLNCCKLGNCVTSLTKPFHMCIPQTVIDSSLWVVFAFLTYNILDWLVSCLFTAEFCYKTLVHDLLNSGCLFYKA